jgi:hypothetical protein
MGIGKRQTEHKRKPQAALQMAVLARKDLQNISTLGTQVQYSNVLYCTAQSYRHNHPTPAPSKSERCRCVQHSSLITTSESPFNTAVSLSVPQRGMPDAAVLSDSLFSPLCLLFSLCLVPL